MFDRVTPNAPRRRGPTRARREAVRVPPTAGPARGTAGSAGCSPGYQPCVSPGPGGRVPQPPSNRLPPLSPHSRPRAHGTDPAPAQPPQPLPALGGAGRPAGRGHARGRGYSRGGRGYPAAGRGRAPSREAAPRKTRCGAGSSGSGSRGSGGLAGAAGR